MSVDPGDHVGYRQGHVIGATVTLRLTPLWCNHGLTVQEARSQLQRTARNVPSFEYVVELQMYERSSSLSLFLRSLRCIVPLFLFCLLDPAFQHGWDTTKGTSVNMDLVVDDDNIIRRTVRSSR
jgi:hypothetical protein